MAKILLVEDDNNLREIYEARLQAEGYDIVSAMDGEEALVVAKKEKPDLVISDVMMPRISGFEMLDILRNTEGLKHVKVIMLTALGQAEDKTRADSLGADRYLVKSQVTLEDIVKAAQELLGPAEPTAAPATTPASPAASPSAAAAPTPTPAPAVGTPAAVPTPAGNTTSETPTPVPAAPLSTPPVAAPAVVPAAVAGPVTAPTPAPQPTPEPAAPAQPSPAVPVSASSNDNAVTVPAAAPAPPIPTVLQPAIPVAPAPQAPTPAPAATVPPVAAPVAPAAPAAAVPSPTVASEPGAMPAAPTTQPAATTPPAPAAPGAQASQAQTTADEEALMKTQIENFVQQKEQAKAALPAAPVPSAAETPPGTPEVTTPETPAPTPTAAASVPTATPTPIPIPPTPPIPEQPAPAANKAGANTDTIMADAIKNLVADAEKQPAPTTPQTAAIPVVAPPQETTQEQPVPPANPGAAAPVVPPAAQPSTPPTPPLSNEDNDSVTIAHKKVIAPLTEGVATPPDLNTLLAKEGFENIDDENHPYLSPVQVVTADGHQMPAHQPGHVISPNATAPGTSGQPVDPNSISL